VTAVGQAATPIACQVRSCLGHRAASADDDDWEESKVNHLVVVVECLPNGDCCEAANKFMRKVRASDGYAVYSEIIGRKVAILGVAKSNKVTGAAKLEEVLLKRGGCMRLIRVGCAQLEPAPDVPSLAWMRELNAALDALITPRDDHMASRDDQMPQSQPSQAAEPLAEQVSTDASATPATVEPVTWQAMSTHLITIGVVSTVAVLAGVLVRSLRSSMRQ